MSAGLLRHYVRVLTPVVTDDGEGGQAVTWSDGPVFWADIRPVSASEQAVAGAIQTIATHRATLHYDARVTETQRFERVAPIGPELQILGVRDPDGRQRWLEVDCVEVV